MIASMLRRTVCATVLAVAFSSSAAAQVTYDFTASLNGMAGGSSGTWTGFVTFNWLTSGGSGTGAASAFVTTAMPGGIASPEQGNDATLWSYVNLNTFTVTGGAVSAFQFGAMSTPDNFVLCANGGGSQFQISPNAVCPALYNRVGVLNSARAENFGGFQGIAFTERRSTEVPEPSAILLLSAGMVGVVLISRRRRSNN